MDNKLTIIDKIRKLLALSESSNEHEAARSAEKVQEMLALHNINLFEVGDKEKEQPVERDYSETRSQLWRRYIYQAVAEMYFCKYYYELVQQPSSKSTRGFVRRELHFLVGLPHNINVAKMVASYLCATIMLLANRGSHDYPKQERARYKKSFHNACAIRLQQRILERVASTKKTETATSDGKNLPALASLYDQAMFANLAHLEKLEVHLVTPKSKIRSSHCGGKEDGHTAAETINLDDQIEKDNLKQIQQ